MTARVQLALNVTDVDSAVDFYSKLLGTAPAKRRPGYANFAVEEPSLKLVLMQSDDAGGTLNHLGVEVGSPDEVGEAQTRLSARGLTTTAESEVACCYANQTKFWTADPDGAPWEVYTVLSDAPHASLEAGDCDCGITQNERGQAVGCC
ncbi:MAG: VOC family protein [Actinomycetota bacterium]|nr:VOC family protein [Actinomycetota bacterium]